MKGRHIDPSLDPALLEKAAELRAVLEEILEQSRDVVDCERASLMMYDRVRDAYVTRLVSGADTMLDNPVFIKIGHGIAGKAVQQRKAFHQLAFG